MSRIKDVRAVAGTSFWKDGCIFCSVHQDIAVVIRPGIQIQAIVDDPMLAIDNLYCPICQTNLRPPGF